MYFECNAEKVNQAIKAASIGEGKGFVITVLTKEQPISKDKTATLCNISSADGEKSGEMTLLYQGKDLPVDKDRITYYASASLSAAAASLAMVTDTIRFTPHSSYLELSDGKDNIVKVALLEKDIRMPHPKGADLEGAVAILVSREKLLKGLEYGKAASEVTDRSGTENVFFHVEGKNLVLLSYQQATAAKAVISDVRVERMSLKKAEEKPEEGEKEAVQEPWHAVNEKFVTALLKRLSGENVKILFTKTFMVMETALAIFQCKKAVASVPVAINELLTDPSYDFNGKVNKKEFLNAMDIALVGVESDDRYFTMETNPDGTLKISNSAKGNKAVVTQEEHEGAAEETRYFVDKMKQIVALSGESFYYYGREGKRPGLNLPEKGILYSSGESGEVSYSCFLLPIKLK